MIKTAGTFDSEKPKASLTHFWFLIFTQDKTFQQAETSPKILSWVKII